MRKAILSVLAGGLSLLLLVTSLGCGKFKDYPGTVAITVVDANTGMRRGFVQVVLEPMGGSSSPKDRIVESVPDNGVVVITKVPPGTYALYIRTAKGQDMEADVNQVVLKPGRTIRLTVKVSPPKESEKDVGPPTFGLGR